MLAERLVRVPTRRSSRVQHTPAAAAAADDETGGRSGVEFLVSWRELPFDQASWEAAEVSTLRALLLGFLGVVRDWRCGRSTTMRSRRPSICYLAQYDSKVCRHTAPEAGLPY